MVALIAADGSLLQQRSANNASCLNLPARTASTLVIVKGDVYGRKD